jgi:exosome complex component RRP42
MVIKMVKIIPEIIKESLTNLVKSGERSDGRTFDEYRDIVLETGIIDKAEGSARVKIGKTQIMVGAKPQLGEPFSDTPNVGVLMTNSELIPMAAPDFESGPPDERSVELSRVTDRCMREAGVVDLEKLCIVEGKKVWMVFLDIHILDYDGNLMDAAVLGSMAALMNTKIPEAKVENDEVVVDHEKLVPLPIKEKALMCTFAKIDGELIVDPQLEEEQVMEARISIGMRADGSICAMQKGGMKPLNKDEILKAVQRTSEITKKLMEHLPQNNH